MDDQERLAALLEDAQRLPNEQRIPLFETAIELADASGDRKQGVDLRIRLAEALEFVGSAETGPIIQDLVDRLDAREITDDEQVHAVLWMNKWLINHLLDDARVDLPRLRGALDAMRRRYRRHKQDPQPVLRAAYGVESHLFGEDAAQAAYAAWVSAPRSDLSDCEACEPTSKARHLAALSRHAEALEVAADVLDGEQVCAEEPEAAIAALLPSLVLVGRGDEAAELHAAAGRAVRGRAGVMPIVADLIDFCARTRNLGRGVELLRARWDDVAQPGSTHDRIEIAAHLARLGQALVAAGYADLTVVPGVSARGLVDRFEREAADLALAFDGRNGTTTATDTLRALRRADDLGPVDLGALGRYPLNEVPVPERSGMTGSPDLRALDQDDLTALTGAIEAADRWGGEAEVLKITSAWEQIRDERLDALATSQDSWELTAAALLEVRGYVAIRCRDPHDSRLVNAEALYRRAGLTGEALLIQERVACSVGDTDRVRALVAEIDRIGTLEEVLRAQLMALRHTDDPDEAGRLAEALAGARAAAATSWRVRRVLAAAATERTEEDPLFALAGVDHALGLLEPNELPEERGELLLARGVLLDELERREEAEQSVVAAGRLAWDAGCPTLWAQALTYRAQAATAGDDLAAAEALLAEASVAAREARQRHPAAQLLLNQAAVLSALGRPVQAAEIAERALPLLDAPADRAAAATQIGEYAAEIGDLSAAREYAALAAREHAGLGPSGSAFAALGELGHLQWRQDDDAEALDTFEAALGQARVMDDPHAETFAHWWRSKPLTTLGRYDEALAALDAADAALNRFEADALIEPELRGPLEESDFAQLRRAFRVSRARTLGTTERYAEALAALGDPADWAADLDHQEVQELAEMLRADLAGQRAQAEREQRRGWWSKRSR